MGACVALSSPGQPGGGLVAARQDVQGCTDVPQERVVGMTRSSLLKCEQCSPVSIEVDIGGRYEITEDAQSVNVLDGQPGTFDKSSDAGCVEASRQGICRTPSTVLTGECALGLGELAGKGSSQHGANPGGDHQTDISTIGENTGHGS